MEKDKRIRSGSRRYYWMRLKTDFFDKPEIKKLRKLAGGDTYTIIYLKMMLHTIESEGIFVFEGVEPSFEKEVALILVKPGTDIDRYINIAGTIFPFIRVEENIRKGVNNIEKRHFRFYFRSPRNEKEISILLDVVFEDNPYLMLDNKPIRSELLLFYEGDDLMVDLPDKNCILADKLTAFAPHTTGIPFGVGKELEIIKQMYDCWTLLQEMDNYEMARNVYRKVSAIELGYRGLKLNVSDCLKDTIDSCMCLIGRGRIKAGDYEYLSSGIDAIGGHIYNGRINGEYAVSYASELLDLASHFLTNRSDYSRIEDPKEYLDSEINIQGSRIIKGLKNTNPLAYAYIIRALGLLQENEIYTGSLLQNIV